MFLLDSNVISELPRKRINTGVDKWFNESNINDMYLSVVTLIEIEKGILLLQRKDLTQANRLNKAYKNMIYPLFENHILPIDEKFISVCASLYIPNPRPVFDSLFASTAIVHDLTLVTRNTKDFTNIDGLSIFNPFD